MQQTMEQHRLVLEDDNNDWLKRINAMKSIQGLVQGERAVPITLIAPLRRGLELQLKDRRSKVVKQVCELIDVLAKQYRNEFEELADHLVPLMSQLTFVTIGVIAQSADDAIISVIKHCRLSVAIVQILDMAQYSASATLRSRCLFYLILLLRCQPSQTIAKYLTQIYQQIERSLHDANEQVRAYAKEALHIFPKPTTAVAPSSSLSFLSHHRHHQQQQQTQQQQQPQLLSRFSKSKAETSNPRKLSLGSPDSLRGRKQPSTMSPPSRVGLSLTSEVGLLYSSPLTRLKSKSISLSQRHNHNHHHQPQLLHRSSAGHSSLFHSGEGLHRSRTVPLPPHQQQQLHHHHQHQPHQPSLQQQQQQQPFLQAKHLQQRSQERPHQHASIISPPRRIGSSPRSKPRVVTPALSKPLRILRQPRREGSTISLTTSSTTATSTIAGLTGKFLLGTAVRVPATSGTGTPLLASTRPGASSKLLHHPPLRE